MRTILVVAALVLATPALADFQSVYNACRWSGQNTYFDYAHRQAWAETQRWQQQIQIDNLRRQQWLNDSAGMLRR